MGYFTFTFANRKLKRNKTGEYCQSCKLGYDGKNVGYIAFPDGTFSEPEHCYMGYGYIAGHEVYKMVAEWNKSYLEEILTAIQKKEGKYFVTDKILKLGIAWQNDHQEIIDEIVERETKDGCITPVTDWKRTIGIAIVNAENIPEIKYPLKIVSSTRKKYEELPPSKMTQ